LISKNIKIKIYTTIILSVVWYGCETWSLTLTEESRLTVFENRVLRRTFVLTRDEKTWDWRTLHKEELSDLYSLPHIVQVIIDKNKMIGVVASMGESSSAYRVVVGILEGNQPLGIPRNIWEDNIKRDLQGVEFGGKDWIDLAMDMDTWRALVNTLMNIGAP
jgi:hypothetical protein